MKQYLYIITVLIGLLFSGQTLRSESNMHKFNFSQGLNNSMTEDELLYDPDTESDVKFTLYFSQGILFIKHPVPQELEEGEVVVFNMLGQVITRKKLENNYINQIPLPNHNTCYIVRISYSGKIFTQKIIASAN